MLKAVFSLSRSWIRNLPISALEIKSGKSAGPMECVEKAVDARNGMHVFHGGRVELPEVHTDQHVAVLFLHHDDRRGPGAVGGTDAATGQHLLDLGHLFLSSSGVLAAIQLAALGSFCLYSVLQEPACSPDRPLLGSQCHWIPGRGPSAAVAGWTTGVRGQEAGDEGWMAAGGGGTSATATISSLPTVCLVCKRSGSGRWLWNPSHTSDPLVSVGTSDRNAGRPSSW